MSVGIDPGAKGALAVRNGTGVDVHKMPDTFPELLNLLRELKRGKRGPFMAYMEKTGGYVSGESAPSAVKFARHCGHVEMALYAAGWSTTGVAPTVWQRALGRLPREKLARKRKIKELMQQEHPDIKVTLINADALGILKYADKHVRSVQEITTQETSDDE